MADGPKDPLAGEGEAPTPGPAPAPGIRVDPLGLGALVTYVLVGGFMVFGFAWMIVPAVSAQNAAPCRPLNPEPRSGPAPNFQVQDLEGNPVQLSDFAGKFVILNFWATWCEPCITEWPQVHRLAARLADDDDVVVIALSIDQDRDAIVPFLDDMSVGDTEVIVLWDPKQEVHKAFGTKQIPDTYFIDEAGDLVSAYINVRSWGTPDAVHCIASVAGR